MTEYLQNIEDIFQGEMLIHESIESKFDLLEKILLDRRELSLNFQQVSFISVYFLERLEKFLALALKANVQVTIKNISPSIYKIFQVAKSSNLLEACV